MEQKRCPTCSKLLNPATDFFHAKLEREIIELIRMADGGTTAGALVGIGFVDAFNRRSLNLEFYAGVEESVIDLYSAARNAYLQRREAKIEE